MLSAMTTSENFPVNDRTRCSPASTYDGVLQPTYVASLLRQNLKAMSTGGNMLEYQLIEEPDVGSGKIAPTISYYVTNPVETDKERDFDLFSEVEAAKEEDQFPTGMPKLELESELTDLLEQLEVDDTAYEQSKPLKIDPSVLKLDFSKISVAGDLESLEKLYFENRRTSHHLSGGGLLTDASQDDFRNSNEKTSNNRVCALLGEGVIGESGNIFNFDNSSDSCSENPGLPNQISPSTPLTFDLSSQSEATTNVTSGISSETESTNPFKNLIKDVLEDENSFSPTNPFSDFCGSSSLNEIPSIDCVPPRYENITLPQKSFSQCSTRPASPVLRIPEETCISNPFLLNETSPESFVPPVPQLMANDANFQKSVTPLQNPSSFIFAVPVFSICSQSITDSSTQTGDFPEVDKPEDPVYQNLTNQVQKFMKRNDHSEYDLQCLKATVKDLRNSGWYYENVSWQESVVLLKTTEPGTFLIRDSSDPNFLFSLSVQTSRGPTSVRLHYVNGQFRLDAEDKLIPHMPSFSSVIELIDYYVENTVKNKGSSKHQKASKKLTKHSLHKSKDQVWIDSQGNVYSNILLVKPLYKKDHFSTLQHLARLTINTCIKRRINAKVKFNFKVTPVYESSPFQDSSFHNSIDHFCPILSTSALPIPPKLIEYLQDYPYSH